MYKHSETSSIDSFLEPLETIASTIHKEKNIEKAVFFILLNLIEKIKLGYSEGYFFKYDKTNKFIKHLNSYFDLKKIDNYRVDFISTYLDNEIFFYGTPLENIISGTNIKTNIKKLDHYDNYKLFSIFNNFTVIPISYENTYYGCLILNRLSQKEKALTDKELHILKLFQYNFSLYLHTRELEELETEDLRLKIIGAFSNSIVHELRTPISSIIGFASLAKKKLDSPEKTTLYLDYIIKESNKLIKLCEDISDYSSEDENIKINLTTFNISETIRKAIAKLNTQLKKSNIKTYLVIEKDIEVTYHKEKVVTAFYHIIKNSIENSDYNKKERFIQITISDDDQSTITIKDNGIGIKKHQINEVTVPFYSSKLYGTGLGLTIAKEVFTKLNFNFSITSEYGQWTKITLKKEI